LDGGRPRPRRACGRAPRRSGVLPAPSLGASEPAGGGDRRAIRMERQLERLASKLAAEAEERRRLEQRLEGLATELTALRASGHQTPQAAARTASRWRTRRRHPRPVLQPARPTPRTPARAWSVRWPRPVSTRDRGPTSNDAATSSPSPKSTCAIRRCGRDGWTRRASARRWRISSSNGTSGPRRDRRRGVRPLPRRPQPAEPRGRRRGAARITGGSGRSAGGDVVRRYGETRIFAPNELVTATRGGVAGEAVRVEIVRQGRRFEIDVPRGPLGIRITASHGRSERRLMDKAGPAFTDPSSVPPRRGEGRLVYNGTQASLIPPSLRGKGDRGLGFLAGSLGGGAVSKRRPRPATRPTAVQLRADLLQRRAAGFRRVAQHRQAADDRVALRPEAEIAHGERISGRRPKRSASMMMKNETGAPRRMIRLTSPHCVLVSPYSVCTIGPRCR